jgi:hypothetical protein
MRVEHERATGAVTIQDSHHADAPRLRLVTVNLQSQIAKDAGRVVRNLSFTGAGGIERRIDRFNADESAQYIGDVIGIGGDHRCHEVEAWLPESTPKLHATNVRHDPRVFVHVRSQPESGMSANRRAL